MQPRSRRSSTIPAAPDFANTITALERSGKLLSRVSAVFYDLVSAHSNPALLEIDKEVSLRMARHWNPIMMNAVLFGRIALLHENRASARPDRRGDAAAGAHLYPLPPLRRRPRRGRKEADGRDQRAAGPSRHRASAIICSATSRTGSWSSARPISTACPDSFVAAARAAASERGMAGKAIVTLSRSSVEPFLKSSSRRDLREKVYKAFIARGDNGNANDNNDDHRGDPQAARGEREAPGLSDLRRLSAGGFDGEDAASRARPAGAGLEAGAGPRAGRSRRPAGAGRGGGRQFRAGARGTGATTPKNCGRSGPISTTPPSSPISRSTT